MCVDVALRRCGWICLLMVLVCLGVQAEDPVDMATPALTGPALGLLSGELAPGTLKALPQEARNQSLYVHLIADWSEIERTPGDYEWSMLQARVTALISGGYQPVLCLTGSNPLYLSTGGLPSPQTPEALDAWLAFVRNGVASFKGQVLTYQILDRLRPVPLTGDDSFVDPEAYAFLLKTSALAARAEAGKRGATIRIAQAALSSNDLVLQLALWDLDVAAYVDLLPVVLDAGQTADDPVAQLRAVLGQSLLHPPASPVWAYVSSGSSTTGSTRAALATASLAAGASAAFIQLSGSAQQQAEQNEWVIGAHAVLTAGFAPAPPGAIRLETADGDPLEGAAVLGRFFRGRDFSSLIFYRATGSPQADGNARLIVDSAVVRNASIIDFPGGTARRVRASAVPGEPRVNSIAIASTDYPDILQFQRRAANPAFELPPEQIETERSREPTVEEIIAGFQQMQQQQDDRLERWIARARVDFHFKLAQAGSSFDVSIESIYFWQRGHDLEWEQTDYYVNGNKVRWKKIPELPLIVPEKVVTVPLDLTLDKTYTYRLVGRTRVDGKDAYALEFQPADPDAPSSLYRGRLLIDAQDFKRLETRVIQTGLEAPVLSNEEVDRYAQHTGPGGESFWLLSDVDGQQVWNTAGRSFVIRRELKFTSFDINPSIEEFESRRDQAYASNNQMLRDTDDGFRYLERQADGSRVVKQEVDTSQLLIGGGAFRDGATDGVTPLGGINYFDYDVAGKKIQLNVFFAGVLGFFTASKPDMFGRKIDATAEAFVSALKSEDKQFLGDIELLGERIETRDQNFSLRFGFPLGQFVKVGLIMDLSQRSFFESDEGRDELVDLNGDPPAGLMDFEFRLPEDHLEWSGTVQTTYSRLGFTVNGSASYATRSDWEASGMLATDTSSGLPTHVAIDPETGLYEPMLTPEIHDSFAKWGLTVSNEWYLAKFQKLRGEVDYLDGADLDRYSRYQFSLFGDDRLSGFAGSGVRFDDGWIARAGYSFNLFELIGFDFTLDSAQIRQDDSLFGRQSFTGAGLSGNVVGPWRTLINVSYGYALSSDIPELVGQDEFMLLIFKLF